MSPCCLDEWTLVVARRSTTAHGARRCNNGAALLRFSNAARGLGSCPWAAGLLILLQRRCSLGRSRPASSAHGDGARSDKPWVAARWEKGTTQMGTGARPDEQPKPRLWGFLFSEAAPLRTGSPAAFPFKLALISIRGGNQPPAYLRTKKLNLFLQSKQIQN